MTEQEMTPWFRAQQAADRLRFGQIEALREGRAPAPPGDALSAALGLMFATMSLDPDLFRAGLEYVATLTPIQQIVQRPDVAAKLRAAGASLSQAPPPPLPGPTRQQLLTILS